MPPPPQSDDVIQELNPTRYPIKSYKGIFVIAKREFFANLKSVRMLVLMILFVLAVLGGSYGISGLSSPSQTLPDVEILAWIIVEDYEGNGPLNDLVLRMTDTEGNPIEAVYVQYYKGDVDDDELLFNGQTDGNGTVVMNDVLDSLFDINENTFTFFFDKSSEDEMVKASISLEGVPKNAYVMNNVLDLDDDNIEDDVMVLVMDKNGVPIEGANVTITSSEDTFIATTNSKGVVSLRNLQAGDMTFEGTIDPRKYDVEVEYQGSTSQNTFYIFMDDTTVEGFFDLEGPNEIIFIIAVLFIVMLGPIIAISLSFDSITREKIQKSLDFLLARPMGRRGIIIGKFLGILSAIALPVTAINLLAVVMISSVTDKSPSGALVAGFIFYSLVLMAIYILLQQIFSTLAKTTGTAILSGIAIWLIFFMFWGLLTLAIGAAAGMQFGSDEWIILNNQISLFNPSGAYSMTMGLLLPDSTGALGIESWMPPVAMIIWFVVLFFLATEIFVRKADS
jgi:Cu-processing system permease protein